MKIFTNNFAIQFTVDPGNAHFKMEESDLEEVSRRLGAGKLRFDGEVFYVAGRLDPDFISGIYALQTSAEIAALHAEIIISFPKKEDLTAFMKNYEALFKIQAAAGGLVTNEYGELLMIYRHDQWDLPKGKVEKGEDNESAAWREVEEETGLKKHKIVRKMCDTKHVFQGRKGGPLWRLKTTHWYEMWTKGRENPVPQTEESITEVKWVHMDDLRKEIPQTYPQIMDLVRQIITQAETKTI